jgi:uncharacterized protein YciI
MDANNTIGERFEMARQLEKDSRLSDAAAMYQKLFDKDPTAQPVVERLLIIYRKLKEYKKELAVLNDAIAALQRRQKAVGEKWIHSHPQAARAGKSMLRQLEKADSVIGLGADPLVGRWLKRKAFVAGKMSGKKGKRSRDRPKTKKTTARNNSVLLAPGNVDPVKKQQQQAKEQRDEAAAIKKAAAQRKQDAACQKKEERERKAAQVSRLKEEQRQKKAEAVRPASLFVIVLHYLVPLEEIDEAMKQHMVYLDKYFKKHDFLVSGRQLPRTGGIILARAKDRAAMEKIINQDPFVKRKLASVDIIEFTASQVAKGLEGWQKPRPVAQD